MKKVQTLIVGGGPSGLGAAYWLNANGLNDLLVLEAASETGGLCRSYTEHGATFDLGGHSFHTPHHHVKALVDAMVPMEYQKRDARIWFGNEEIPYPFQQHFRQLKDNTVIEECELELQRREQPVSEATDFEDYLIRKFGHGIAKHFMIPYNRKLWARDLKSMSAEWTSQRIADTDKKPFGTGGDRTALQDDTYVGYPAIGGFQRIFDHLAATLYKGQLKTRARVTRVHWKNKVVEYTENGMPKLVHYDRLVTTAPINVFVSDILASSPPDLVTAAAKLEYLSLSLLMIALSDNNQDVPQRLYVSDETIPAHKIVFNSTASPTLREMSSSGVSCEMSFSSTKPLPHDTEAQMLSFLGDNKYINPDAIVNSEITNVKMAYPVYTPDRPEALRVLKEALEFRDIWSIGRFGSWDYINSDKCLDESFRLVENHLT